MAAQQRTVEQDWWGDMTRLICEPTNCTDFKVRVLPGTTFPFGSPRHLLS